MSEVRVVVMDCTETGASPPTATEPTWILRLTRRSASLAGTDGIPSEMAVMDQCNPTVWTGGLQGLSLRHLIR